MKLYSILFFLTGICSTSYLNAETYFYRATFRDDPATTMVIQWSGDAGTVHYGKEDKGTDFDSYPNSQYVDRSTAHRGLRNYFVRLENLDPNTVYYFVIKDIFGEVSERMSIQTLPDNPEQSISFINGGDTRKGVDVFETCKCREARQDGNKLVAKLRPDVVVFNGDFIRNTAGGIYPQGTRVEWKQWFTDWQLTIGPDGRLAPLVLSTGNHEDDVDNPFVENPDFKDLDLLFDVPNTEVYYALTFGGCLFRLYSLNTEIDACTEKAQLNWLKEDLENFSQPSNTPYWKFVSYHQPIIPHSDKENRVDLYNCWAPLFEQYRVKLAMESHSHIMKTTWPIVPNDNIRDNNGYVRDDENGTVYIGEGNWAAPQRSLYPPNPWTREQASIRSFFYVTVSKDKIDIVSTMFDNVDDVEQALDNEPGSPLPNGVKLYDVEAGANNGAILTINNDVTTAMCAEIVDTTNVDTTTTGILTRNLNSAIYPNPSVDELFITLKNFKPVVSIEVMDARGKKCSGVQVNSISSNKYSVDVRELCSGVNFIFVKYEKDVEVHKFIRK